MSGVIMSVKRFISDDERGLSTVEFAILSPIMVIIAFCLIQFMLMAHAMVVMKQAGYAAARSALVNDCPPPSLKSASENLFGAVNNLLFNKCEADEEKYLTAARVALMPISASNGKSKARQGGSCTYPEALIKILQKDAVRGGLKESLENKACYAFEPGNVAVKVEWETVIPGIGFTAGPPPVKATVQFKLPILAPVRKIFSHGKRSDNTHYWQGEVKVSLL